MVNTQLKANDEGEFDGDESLLRIRRAGFHTAYHFASDTCGCVSNLNNKNQLNETR